MKSSKQLMVTEGGFYTNNRLKLNIPVYSRGISTWNTLNYGWGFDLMLYRFNFSTSVPPSYSMETSIFNMSYIIHGSIGYTCWVSENF